MYLIFLCSIIITVIVAICFPTMLEKFKNFNLEMQIILSLSKVLVCVVKLLKNRVSDIKISFVPPIPISVIPESIYQ